MLTSWVVFGMWGMIAGVILPDFGEQGALVSNRTSFTRFARKRVTG
jgi:hypothetical protein